MKRPSVATMTMRAVEHEAGLLAAGDGAGDGDARGPAQSAEPDAAKMAASGDEADGLQEP